MDFKKIKILCLCCVCFLVCCNQNKDKNQASIKPVVPVSVIAAKVEQKTIPFDIKSIGNVEAYASVLVKAQVGGMIVKQLVKDGGKVNKGDLLFIIDPKPFEANLKEAKAKLDRDLALLAKAQDDTDRYKKLIDKNIISKEQYDQAYSNMKVLQSTVRLDEVEIEKAKLDIEYTSIKAAISGVIGNIFVSYGNVVKPNDDRSFCVINQIEPIYISFSVPESYFLDILKYNQKQNLEVKAFIDTQDNKNSKNSKDSENINYEIGELAAIDNSIDKTTGTIKLKAIFSNSNKKLWPGQFVKLSLKLTEIHNALIIPSQAIQTGINGQFVFIIKQSNNINNAKDAVKGNIADICYVKAGKIMDQETIIERGLSLGDIVVTEGQVLLVPGKPVNFKFN